MIDPDLVVDVGEWLLKALRPRLEGYGENATVTAVAIVTRVHFDATPGLPAESGQTLVTGEALIHADDAQRRAYVLEALRDAVSTLSAPPVDPNDLPPWP